jgi:hypothetical protein
MAPPSLFVVKALIILANDGKRLLGRYYDAADRKYPSANDKRLFEKSLFAKTSKANVAGEILMIDNLTVVYKNSNDLYFYVVGSTDENELMLMSILNCFYELINLTLKRRMEKKYLLNSLDLVFLGIDLMCDDGVLLECDAGLIYKRVKLKENDVPLSEQSVMDVIKTAKNQIKNSSVFK